MALVLLRKACEPTSGKWAACVPGGMPGSALISCLPVTRSLLACRQAESGKIEAAVLVYGLGF